MGLAFEWDPRKARQNERKHGISFEEAVTAHGDDLSLTIADPIHDVDEDRFVTLRQSVNRRLLVVVHADRGDNIRIISARRATRQEQRAHEETDATGN